MRKSRGAADGMKNVYRAGGVDAMTVDSRKRRRYQLSFSVELDAGERKQRVAVSRNVSANGLLVVSASRFDVGDQVVVRFDPTGRGNVRELCGQVVRRSQRPDAGLWQHMAAVQFEAPDDELDAQLSALADRDDTPLFVVPDE